MTRVINFVEQAAEYTALWNSMAIHAEKIPAIDSVAKLLYMMKPRLLKTAEVTHVPWHTIAVIRYREGGIDPGWRKNIANGQSWEQETTIVPKGRGPFHTWEEAAYDALVNCTPHASRWKDWSIGGELCLLEQYNGEGYWEHGWANPYLWSFSNHYVRGKYGSDGHYNPGLVDAEIGCAPLIARLYVLDKTISAAHMPEGQTPDMRAPEPSNNYVSQVFNGIKKALS